MGVSSTHEEPRPHIPWLFFYLTTIVRKRSTRRASGSSWLHGCLHCQLLWIAAAVELRLQPSIIDCAHIHTNVSPVARGACVKASPGARHVGSFTESKRVIIAGVRSGKISHVT